MKADEHEDKKQLKAVSLRENRRRRDEKMQRQGIVTRQQRISSKAKDTKTSVHSGVKSDYLSRKIKGKHFDMLSQADVHRYCVYAICGAVRIMVTHAFQHELNITDALTPCLVCAVCAFCSVRLDQVR